MQGGHGRSGQSEQCTNSNIFGSFIHSFIIDSPTRPGLLQLVLQVRHAQITPDSVRWYCFRKTQNARYECTRMYKLKPSWILKPVRIHGGQPIWHDTDSKTHTHTNTHMSEGKCTHTQTQTQTHTHQSCMQKNTPYSVLWYCVRKLNTNKHVCTSSRPPEF